MTDALGRLKAALADRYTIERELGVGGMATVYLAEDIRHHRKVAVKVLRSDIAAALGPERFLQEIEIAAQLQHPNILPLYDSGEADGFLFYVMPHIEGPSLREKLVKEGELPIADAVRILRDVVDALTEAHAHGVVHRDIKPENILLSGRHALVTDFGVAKAVSEATGRAKLTTAGVALGTPAYMAPEQASADPHLDQRVDIYAVGAVAYELLTGRPVFMGTTPQMILSAHMTEPPQPVTKHRDTVPAALDAVVMRCLEKRPADRWQSAEELLPQLEVLATPSGGVTPTETRPVAATVRGRGWLVPGVMGALVLIVLGFVGMQLLKHRPVTVTTSNIRPVTSDPALDWHPALSPDGSQVAFASVRDGLSSVVVRSTREIGTGLPLAQGLPLVVGLRWSRDGESVRFGTFDGTAGALNVVSRLGGPVRSLDLPQGTMGVSPDGVYAIRLSGDSVLTDSITAGTSTLLFVSEISRVGNVPSLHSFAWSPDGRRIAYVDGNPWWLGSFNAAASSIWIADADGGEPARVTGDEFMDVSPAWLDDDHLLFVSNRDGPREVYVVEVGSTGPRREPQKVPGIIDPHSISYSVAGGNLACAKATARQNIRAFPIGSTPVSVTTGRPVTDENAVIEAHDISPDGQWIVYNSTLRGNSDIYRMPLDGGTAMRITNLPGDESAPRWSPDGTEIVFSSGIGLSSGVLSVVRADGGTPVQVTSGHDDWLPGWSPSGLDIAFTRFTGPQRETWIVSRETVGGPWGEATQVTDFGCFFLDWAPDGGGLLCLSGGDLLSVDFSGTDLLAEDLLLVSREGEVLWRYAPSTPWLPALGFHAEYSADGSTIFVSGTRQDGARGIWTIPATGGEPSPLVVFDDAAIDWLPWFSVGHDRLYVTVAEWESDIWVMDVEVGR
jgi:Tol biopolymer transport system component